MRGTIHVTALLCLLFVSSAKVTHAFSADDAYQCVIGNLEEAKKKESTSARSRQRKREPH